MTRVSIVGASGYVGGELLRLLLRHPQVSIHQVTPIGRFNELLELPQRDLSLAHLKCWHADAVLWGFIAASITIRVATTGFTQKCRFLVLHA